MNEEDKEKEEDIMEENKTPGFGGMDGLLPNEPTTPPEDELDGTQGLESDDVQPDVPVDEKPEQSGTGKNKKWLVMIVAAVVLWLLLKKK